MRETSKNPTKGCAECEAFRSTCPDCERGRVTVTSTGAPDQAKLAALGAYLRARFNEGGEA